ncbi:MAG: hypothetical protein C4K47_07590 [Candidatus Thorarchaeota archaeon]|nr:MAG: hypothetical protein C4K47_07590 [Candidatus Thorarchaeota archaeon]
MDQHDSSVSLSPEAWAASSERVAEELRSFIRDMGSFSPDWFVEVKFHLLRQSGLTKASRAELCRISIQGSHCKKCEELYEARTCLLWSRLFSMARTAVDDRCPPCIRIALSRNSLKTVANFLTSAYLIDAPFYKHRKASSCKTMAQWGYCRPDEYCRGIKSGNPLEYISARERVKLARPIH